MVSAQNHFSYLYNDISYIIEFKFNTPIIVTYSPLMYSRDELNCPPFFSFFDAHCQAQNILWPNQYFMIAILEYNVGTIRQ